MEATDEPKVLVYCVFVKRLIHSRNHDDLVQPRNSPFPIWLTVISKLWKDNSISSIVSGSGAVTLR